MLEYIEVRKHGREDSKKRAKYAAIFIHGYGADAQDLAPLSHELELSHDIDWFFPNGIHSAGFGRAWFNINLQEFESAMREGRPRRFSKQDVDNALPAKEAVLSWIREEIEPNYEKIILGGFSQGAMLTLEVGLELKSPAALVLLSGGYLNRFNWPEKTKAKVGQKFFQSHGRTDAILDFASAKELNEMLFQSGWKGTWVDFEGGHDIPSNVMKKLSQFLSAVLEDRAF